MNWPKFRQLVNETVERLKAAAGDRDKIETALQRYIDEGHKLGMSPYILWDYFAISSPGIPERAGYAGSDRKQCVGVFEALSKRKFGG
jgi:hypothetical protein